MEHRYKQLSLEDRCEIARLQANGRSLGQIAAALDRAASTISRELRRNRGREVGYKPSYAQEQAKARRCGRALASNASPTCAAPFWNALPEVGPPSRSPAGWPARPAAS